MTENLRDLIAKHKAAVKTDGAPKTLDSVFSALEKLVEDTGQKERFAKVTTDYIVEKTTEIQSIRATRFWLLLYGVVLSFFSFFGFYFIVLCPKSHNAIAAFTDNSRVAFIAASFISAFGLIAIIIRGILRTGDKEEGLLPMQESIKNSLQDIIKDLSLN